MKRQLIRHIRNNGYTFSSDALNAIQARLVHEEQDEYHFLQKVFSLLKSMDCMFFFYFSVLVLIFFYCGFFLIF